MTANDNSQQPRSLEPDLLERTQQVCPDASEQQLEQLYEVFCLFDSDGSGAIDNNEIGDMMRALGQNPTNADIEEMICKMDVIQPDGKVQFEEFAKFSIEACSGHNPEDELIAAFRLLDKNDSGKIPVAELRTVLRTLGESMSDEEIEEMISSANQDNDDFIDYYEFVNLWCGSGNQAP